MEYIDFLKSKRIKPKNYGFDVNINDISPVLFDWQKAVVKWSLKKGRAALFEDCGLGKTLQQVEWSRQVINKTGGKVLILAPLAVSSQTKKEAEKLNLDIRICRSNADVGQGINITNYEMIDHFDTDAFDGVVLDESSILKSFTGKTKKQLIERFKDTPYKLACTATPAPNDHMELLNHAEFLGIMRSSEALAIWFINDTKSSGKYRLKKHAVKSFWEWVSTFAVCMNAPADIGFSNKGYSLPPLNEHEIILGQVNPLEQKKAINATAYYKEMKKSAADRVNECAKLTKEYNDRQIVIWCYTNDESDMLKKAIPGSVEVKGSDKMEHKEQSALDFTSGNIRVLISKPRIFGYGLNFQNCNTSIFCGMNYSYEDYYQATRRFWRFGQTSPVDIFKVIGAGEQNILQAVSEKEKRQSEMHENMYGSIKDIQTNAIKGVDFKLNIYDLPIRMPDWLKKEA